MVSYKEFLADAISNYESLPSETNDLYKKYYIDVPLDVDGAGHQADVSSEVARAEAVSREITEKTRIKFDAVISEHYVKSFNNLVGIVKAEEAAEELLEGKMFKSSEDKLAAFSNAHSRYFITVESKEGKKESVNLLFISSGRLPSQIMLRAGTGSKLGVFELHVSGTRGGSLASVLHEVSAGNGSEVELDVLHDEGADASVVGASKLVASEGARLRANFIYVGGKLTKAKNIAYSSGRGSQVEISELAFGGGEQRFDLGNSVTNSSPSSSAKLESGAALDGKSQCILKGYAKVEKGTKGCFSRITERGILLSKDAHIDALPDMSIDYSNEVKATHSAATAPIDSESLFYLQSRGLSEQQARRVFITAFIAKYAANMGSGVAREVAMSVMLEKLETGSFGTVPDVTARGTWALK